jgi:SPP1 family predicted phage head-tail adaptor
LITNNSDFEKAYTNFTIRYPKAEITRKMLLKYNNKIYTIEYLNNIDEANIELEIQAKVVDK